jgi:MoxR-like ATPase
MLGVQSKVRSDAARARTALAASKKSATKEGLKRNVILAAAVESIPVEAWVARMHSIEVAAAGIRKTRKRDTALPEVLVSKGNVPLDLVPVFAKLEEGLLERGVEVRLLVLAALLGEHVLFLGPPGTAKSEICRRLSTLCEGRYFERLMTRFTLPEEIFGPLSLRELERDVYSRKIEGFLPTSDFVFLDEIFKSNSAILNSLLGVMNERVLHNPGKLQLPLRSLVAASNEPPEGQELDAMYDRFLFRRYVRQLSVEGRLQLIATSMRQSRAPAGTNDGMFDLRAITAEDTNGVVVPGEVVDFLKALLSFGSSLEPPMVISDRRLLKTVAMLKGVAHTCGRDQVRLAWSSMVAHIHTAYPVACAWLLCMTTYCFRLHGANPPPHSSSPLLPHQVHRLDCWLLQHVLGTHATGEVILEYLAEQIFLSPTFARRAEQVLSNCLWCIVLVPYYEQ